MKFKKHFKLLPYWSEWLERARSLKTALETEVLEVDGRYGFGGQSCTIPPDKVGKFIKESLSELYHRDNLALKIFYNQEYLLSTEMYECFWERGIIETSRIQNILAYYGIAPRVYDLVFLVVGNKKLIAQVTDFISGETPRDLEPLRQKISEISVKHDVFEENVREVNFVGDKFVDFGRWYFDYYYKERFQDRIREALKFAGSDLPYQSIERLQIKGQRENLQRHAILEKEFEKDKLNNFTVIDYGCNGGFFIRSAFEWGAEYAVGVDTKQVIDIAYEINNFLDFFNADFFTELPDRKFDIGFYLSMDRHTDFATFVPLVNKILYLEGHSGDPKEKYEQMLKPYFKEVKYLGEVNDYGRRVLFKAVK